MNTIYPNSEKRKYPLNNKPIVLIGVNYYQEAALSSVVSRQVYL